MGDHTVVGVFTDLTYIVIPVLFMTLGIIVSFVQAFVFTLLSMVYVSLATAHDH
jgi:F-type H+-transporting ATPase subunit a